MFALLVPSIIYQDMIRAVASGGGVGGVTPPDDCSYEQFQVNSGRFAEEIQVNQRKFR